MSIKNKFIIVSVVFFGLILFSMFKNKAPVDSSASSSVSVLGLTQADKLQISRLRLTGSLGSYDLSKANLLKSKSPVLVRSPWVLREPLFAPVNESSVVGILDLLFDLKGEIVPFNDLDKSKISDYGLEPPAFVVMINLNEQNIVLSFGQPNDVTGRLFVQKEGDPYVYLIPDVNISSIKKLLGSIRSYNVLNFDIAKVNHFDVIRGESFYRLKQDNCNSKKVWKIETDGMDMNADKSLVEKKLTELASLKVNKIYDNPFDILQFTGLASPVLIMKIQFNLETELECKVSSDSELKNKDEILIQIGKGVDISKASGGLVTTPAYYMKIAGENVVYELQSGIFGDWLQGAEHFRNKTPFENYNLRTSQKVEVVLPDKKCAVISKLADDDGIKMLEHNLTKLKLDTIISIEEFTDFEKVNGAKLTFQENSNCSNGFEQIGLLHQDQGDGLKKPVATILKVTRCEEKEMYGVTEIKNFSEFTTFLENYCK